MKSHLKILNALAYRATSNLIQRDEVGGTKAADREQEYMTGVLEALVDRYGLSVTLSALADVAESKADHISEMWKDKPLAASWRAIALKMNGVALSANNALRTAFRPTRVMNPILDQPSNSIPESLGDEFIEDVQMMLRRGQILPRKEQK